MSTAGRPKFLIIIIVVIAAAAGGYWYWSQKKAGVSESPGGGAAAVEVTDGLGAEALNKTKNPLSNELPATNPFQVNTNPFEEQKNPFNAETNPFTDVKLDSIKKVLENPFRQ